ncbi:MAG: HAMP domain-containing histidine kinase [Candidatus Saganbacteria bacterium]|nr:HAMP domain-containing histidine kinase [Candidatus Saganbacteria bacterium]
MTKKVKINRKHIAEVRREHESREKKRHQHKSPFEELVSDFISTISHELRTPMAIIKEGLSLISEEKLGPTTSAQSRALTLSLNSLNRLIRLVDELLDISRLEREKLKLHKKFVNLTALADEIFLGFESMAKKHNRKMTFHVAKGAQDIPVYIDEDRVTQVLVNIVDNAFKYTQAGDRIDVFVGKSNHQGFVSIKDNGPGISKEEQHLVFDKFHQVKKKGIGTKHGLGLGLSISEQVVKLHGGRIEVKSKMGHGTEFIIEIPLAILFLHEIVKLIHQQPLSDEETEKMRHYGLMRLLIEAMEYPALDIDEKEQILESFQSMQLHRGNLPIIWDHIEDFRRMDLKNAEGRPLRAKDYREAFLMAYIEKNMGDFLYRKKPIYAHGDTVSKRKALMSLVKELTPKQVEKSLAEIEKRD